MNLFTKIIYVSLSPRDEGSDIPSSMLTPKTLLEQKAALENLPCYQEFFQKHV